jgi:hypothetical protein
VVLDTVYSNAGGVASFTNVPAGTYDFEVYYNNEFWGNPSRQTVAVGNIRNLDFVRYMPYARSVKIDNSSLGLGDNGHVNIVVENPSLNLSNVKARFILDRNKSPGYDYDQWSSPQSIIPLTDTSYLFTFSPSATLELGDYYSCVEISTEVNNRYVETDSWPWSDAKLLTVSLSAEVFLQHCSGKVYHNEDDPIIYADELDDYTLVIRSPFSGEAELRDDSGFPKVFYHGTMTRQGNAYQAVYKFKASDLNWDSNDPAGNNFIIELHRSDNQDKPYYYYYRFNLRAFGRSRIIEELSIMEDALGALADFAANQGVDWSAKITVPFNAYNKAYLAAIEPTQYNGLQKIKITAVSAADPSAAKELIVGPSSIDFTVKDGIYTTTYSKQRIGQSLSDLPQINYQLEGGNVYVSPPAEKLSIGVTYGPEGFASAAEAENGEKYLLKNVRVKAAIQNDLKDTLVTGGGELLSGMLAALTLAEAVDLYAQGPQSTSKATATLASFGAGAVAGDAALSLVGVGVIGGVCSAGAGIVVGAVVYYLVDYVLPHPTEEILSKDVEAGKDAYLGFPLINQGSQTHIYQAVINSPLSLNTVDCTGTLPIIGSGCNVLGSNRYSIVSGGYANIKMKFMPTTSTEGIFPITLNFKEEESGIKWVVRGWVKVKPWQANSQDSSPKILVGPSDNYQAVKQNTSYLSYSLTIESGNTINQDSVSVTWPSLYYNLNGRNFLGLTIYRSQQYIDISVPPSGDTEILARSPSIVTIDNYWDTGFCVIEHNGEIVYQNGRIIDQTLVSSVAYNSTNHTLTLYVNHWDNYTIITDPAFLAPQIKTVLFDGKVLVNGDYVTARPMIEAVVEDRTAEALALKVEVFSFPAANSITSALVSMAVNSANGVSRSSLALAVPLTAGEYYACLTVSNEAGATSTFTTPNFRVASAFNFTAICGPNPFSPNGDGAADTTKISYQLSSDARIKIRIVGLDGRAVKNFDFDPGTPLRSTAGYNEVEWDGRDNNGAVVGNGLYLCYILADSGTDLIKQKLQIAVLR